MHTELGLKPFRQLLFERQLKFYFRVLFLHEDRWVHQAMMEHLSGSWQSPYVMHISHVRAALGVFSATSDPGKLKKSVGDYFLASVNSSASSLPWIMPLKSFSRASYVCENILSTVITEFKLECPGNIPNTGLHLLFKCGSLSGLRQETGIQSYVNLCLWKGLSLDETCRLFVNGLDWSKKPVSKSDFLERGKCMSDMRILWLTKW